MLLNPIKIKSPLKGRWVVMRRPDCNPLALDLRKTTDKGKKLHKSNILAYLTTGVPVEKFYSWGEPVYSPAEAKVKMISDGYPDKMKVSFFTMIRDWFKATFLYKPDIYSGNIDIRPCAGNFVMLELGTGQAVFLAHLKSGSIKVKVGDKVKTGDVLANVGNSGNSTAPQLLLHVFDKGDNILTTNNIRFCFESYKCFQRRKWNSVNNSFPEMKEVLEFS